MVKVQKKSNVRQANLFYTLDWERVNLHSSWLHSQKASSVINIDRANKQSMQMKVFAHFGMFTGQPLSGL